MKTSFRLAVIFFLFPTLAFAYSTYTTHPALSDEIVDFYNASYPLSKLTEEEKELIKTGSIEEDVPITRAFNHFFDPVYNLGLRGLNPTSKEWAMNTNYQRSWRTGSLAALKPWNEYFSAPDDYSWERAIFDYAHKDKERGLKALGYILHLIEDATVPDHTRDDMHPPAFEMGSPYEGWAEQWTPENLDIANGFIADGEKPILYPALAEYFDTLAKYSNNNFFSKDTILEKKYVNPTIKFEKVEILSDRLPHKFGYNQFDSRLVEIKETVNSREGKIDRSYKLTSTEDLILSDYWKLLSRQAVQNGAGVIKLFFDEAEKEKKTLALLEKNRSALARLIEKAKESVANALSSSTTVTNPNAAAVAAYSSQNTARDENGGSQAAVRGGDGSGLTMAGEDARPQETNSGSPNNETQPSNIPRNVGISHGEEREEAAAPPRRAQTGAASTEETVTAALLQTTQTLLPSISPASVPPPAPPRTESSRYFRLSPAGGGGGGVSNPPQPAANNSQPADTPQSPPSEEGGGSETDTAAPSAPTVTSPANNAILTNAAVAFSGAAEASSTISTDFSSATTSASAGGSWTLTLSLGQGTTSLQFFAEDSAGNRSGAATTTVFVDSLAPSVTLSVSECSSSLSASSCLVATTTLSLSWSSGAGDVSHFTLDRNGVVSTTTATSTAATAPDRAAYTVSVSATDTSGNRSATSTQVITVHTLPVVMNEIAWAGTSASPYDEWIELKNNTEETLSLDNFTLFAGDLSPYLPLSGTIAPNGYYLIERKNSGETAEAAESSVTDITADLWTGFGVGLNNNGENMALAFKSAGGATTTIDSVPTCTGWGPKWCAGDDSNYKTMERYDSLASGSVQTNWHSNLGEFIRNGKGADGSSIDGTARARNSVSHLIVSPSLGSTLSSDKTLTAVNSPYLVSRTGLVIAQGTTLTIDPGVVIKIVSNNEPWIQVLGTIKANGTAANPVVFTAFTDDEYGGDMNKDGAATTPVPGSWRRILIDTTSIGSSFTHTLVRYGGNNNTSDPLSKKGAIGVDSAAVTFDHLTVEKSGFHGLSLQNTNSAVSHSRFSTSTSAYVSSSGVYISGGSPSVSDSVFSGNYRGITVENATPTLTDNAFTGNLQEAVLTNGIPKNFSGNSGSGNGKNAILVQAGAMTSAGATTTLLANSLPYLIRGTVTVAHGSALSLAEGVIIKGWDSAQSDYGEIKVQSGAALHTAGTAQGGIVFTSMHDGAAGGEISSGTHTPSPGDWKGITVEAGGRVALSGFTLRYAGAGAFLWPPADSVYKGALKITGNSATSSGSVSNALFEKNYQSGLNLDNVSSLSVSGVTFQNHTEKNLGNASAVYAKNSAASFSDIVFGGNAKDAIGEGANSLTCANCGTPSTAPANLFGL